MVFKPTTFGKYVLLKRIAIGGMAEVFRAKAFGAEGFEKLVAVKRMLPHLSSDAQFVEMFINEAKLAAVLNHVNVAQIYDFGCIDKLYFISLEYVYGKDIADIIRILRERNLTTPLELACFLMIEVLNGLDYAHRLCDPFGRPQGLIHRDVSPHNILVSYEGEVKLVDFGIAKATSSTVHTTGGVLKGKYSYMSPEQAHGVSLDHRSDIFSLAICFYELLTLTKMFQAESDLGVLEKVRETDFLPPRQINPLIPEELEEIILRALEKNPEDRFESAAQFRDALEQFLFQRHLHYSTSWLAGFMREIFREEIEKEREEFAEEAQLAQKMRSEAKRQARLAEVENSPDTVVLHRTESNADRHPAIEPGEEPEDTQMETREVSKPFIGEPGPASVGAFDGQPVEEVSSDEVMEVGEVEQLPSGPQDEFLPTEKMDRPRPDLFEKVVGELKPRKPAVRPAIREVFGDDTMDTVDESTTTTERKGRPSEDLLPTMEEPSMSGAQPLKTSDFEIDRSTLKERGSQDAARAPATERGGEFFRERERKFPFGVLLIILLAVAAAGSLLALVFHESGADDGEKKAGLPPRRLLPEPAANQDVIQPRKEPAVTPPEAVATAVVNSSADAGAAEVPETDAPQGAEKATASDVAATPPVAVSPEVEPKEDRSVRPARTKTNPKPAGSGVISVNEQQGWAKVYINGKYVSDSPLLNHRLRAGVFHVIELKDGNGGLIKRWRVRLRPEQTLKLIH